MHLSISCPTNPWSNNKGNTGEFDSVLNEKSARLGHEGGEFDLTFYIPSQEYRLEGDLISICPMVGYL